MLLVTLSACGNLSNAPFTEDADYLDAFPSTERTEVDIDDEAEAARTTGDRVYLRDWSLSTAASINSSIVQVLSLVDTVRTYPPSSRSDDGRTWGPYADAYEGVDIAAWINRTGDRFDWGFTGDDTTFFSGTHYSGETVATGDGQFVWDGTTLAGWADSDATGTYTVDYDNRTGVDVIMHVDDWSDGSADPVPVDYAWLVANGTGDFQYRTAADLPDDGTDTPADIGIHTRWLAGAGGRGDASATGGALGDTTLHWSQCWDSGGALTYQWDDFGYFEAVGDASDCAYTEFSDLDRI